MEIQESLKPKKIFKIIKITALFSLVLVVLAVGYFTYRLSNKDLFGWRLNFGLSKVETKDYKSIAPNIAFKYPTIFELDVDKDKKYGTNYVVGIKLATDNRTGCDIRRDGPQLDLSKLEKELTDEITNPIKEKASDFQLIENKKVKIGQEPAFEVSFSFLDPIGARVRLDQIFISKQSINYMIICGTGEYQYEFFKKDFQTFYDSINF